VIDDPITLILHTKLNSANYNYHTIINSEPEKDKKLNTNTEFVRAVIENVISENKSPEAAKIIINHTNIDEYMAYIKNRIDELSRSIDYNLQNNLLLDKKEVSQYNTYQLVYRDILVLVR
jgi:hypothetical protein